MPGEVLVAHGLRAAAAAEDERAEGARRRDRVGEEVEEDARAGASAAPASIADDADEHVAGVRDARVREHALDRLLPPGDEVRDRHREHGERRRSPAASPLAHDVQLGVAERE